MLSNAELDTGNGIIDLKADKVGSSHWTGEGPYYRLDLFVFIFME